MLDRLNRAVEVHGNFLYDQIYVVTTKVVEKHRYVVDDFALFIAKIVRSNYVVTNHMIVVVDLLPVGVLRIKRTIGAVPDATLNCFNKAATLRLCQVFYRFVCLQELNALGLLLDELILVLLERVLFRKKNKICRPF